MALPEFTDIPSLDTAFAAGELFGYPYMLKNKRLAYDGKGNFVVKSRADVEFGFAALGGAQAGLYAEKWVR